jgi:hypothetical protein
MYLEADTDSSTDAIDDFFIQNILLIIGIMFLDKIGAGKEKKNETE